MRYTIRGIPAAVDQAIRDRAKAEAKSLNEVVIDMLSEVVKVRGRVFIRRDLSDITGTWKKENGVEKAISDQEKTDESLCK